MRLISSAFCLGRADVANFQAAEALMVAGMTHAASLCRMLQLSRRNLQEEMSFCLEVCSGERCQQLRQTVTGRGKLEKTDHLSPCCMGNFSNFLAFCLSKGALSTQEIREMRQPIQAWPGQPHCQPCLQMSHVTLKEDLTPQQGSPQHKGDQKDEATDAGMARAAPVPTSLADVSCDTA